MSLRRPYLLFVGDARDDLAAKTAHGILDWRRDWCLGKLSLPGCQARLDLPEVSIDEAAARGAGTLVVGVAVAGGALPDTWVDTLVAAVEAGLDVANGLHQRLVDIPRLADAAESCARLLFDARHPQRAFGVGTGAKRAGKRLLAVGTDCSVGKMYTALAMEREMRARGMKATFRATGQTGIFIAGEGISVDAVVSDFISGAIEWLAPDNDPDHWDVIEGQASLFHPSFAGVTLGLVHGAQPDAMVLCHEPTRTHMRGLPHRALPAIAECIEAHEYAARMVNPAARVVGVAVNTRALERAAAGDYLARLADELGLPCVDPLATGVGAIVDRLP
ncbi:MAG: DUF1611 domain-containing protein [Hyphomicrobiales bacterium]|nr:DUF1611 domain-containing protein [Hyphomicrobiales bacterium]MCP5370888.1 DUF1611 domain-containing protein [Hyphomicrobiales bacterium]